MKGCFSFSVPQNRISSFKSFVETKKDVINVVLASLDLFFSGVKEDKQGNLKFLFGDVKRILYFEEERYYSVAFPFSLYEKNDDIDNNLVDKEDRSFCEKYSLWLDDDEITSSLLVYIHNIVETMQSVQNYSLDDLYESVDDLRMNEEGTGSEELFFKAWRVVCNLFLMEDAYVRYDYDVNHEKKNHPLNHLDVNYSSYGTYKIGLPKVPKPKTNWFVELCSSNPVKMISKL